MKTVIKIENKYQIQTGVETGFIDTFFSSANPALGKIIYNKNESDEAIIYNFGEDDYDITATDRIKASSRELTYVFNKDVHLMDMVQRFILKKEDVKYIIIGDKKIYHARRNFYHQFMKQSVQFHLKDGEVLIFTPTIHCDQKSFSPLIYVRDEPDSWIFHVRLLCTDPDFYSIKGCSSLYHGAFPSYIQNLCSFLGILKPTLYIRERISQRIPFQTNGASKIPKGTKISLQCNWTITI